MPRGKYKRRDKAIYEVPPAGSPVLVYCRFSGTDQDASSQEAAIRRWVEEQGWIVCQWFQDEARSGSSTEGRESFLRMIALAESLASSPDRPAGVVYWKRDRFGRDSLDNQYFTALLRRLGYCLVGKEDGIPPSAGDLTPLLETVKDIKAAWDLADISANVKRGMAYLRSLGYQTGGFPPRGLLVVREPLLGPDGKQITRKNGTARFALRWVPDPALAPLVQQAFTMRVEGAGYAAILRGALRGIYRSTSCLSTFFANRNYVTAGVITEELFSAVGAVQLRHARKEGAYNPKSLAASFLLTGLVVCRCGAAMVGETVRGRWRYYRCGRRMRDKTCACTQPEIPAHRLEEPILGAILSCVMTPERIADLTEAVNVELNGDDGLQAKADCLRQQIADVETVIARLVAALERGGPLESLLGSLKGREAERRKLRADLALVEAEIRERRPTVLTPQEVADLLGEIRQHREAEDTLELRAILRLVIESVTVDGQDYRIHFRPEARPWFVT
jgi:DNA invertase Pin-like site-specific DNA recombinase